MTLGSQGWLFRTPQLHAPTQLFCFPYAGGGISSYLPWQAVLGSQVEVACVQLPGRGARLLEPCIDSFQTLIEELTNLIIQHANRPYVLFGHSLGGLMAFEVTRALRKRQKALPKQLIISACEAPQSRSVSRHFHELDDHALIQVLSKLNGTPSAILENKELIRLLLPGVRADFKMNSDYVYMVETPLELPVIALAGENDSHVRLESIVLWREQTSDEYKIHLMPGDHFFIDSHRNVVLDLLKNIIKEI